MAHHLHFAPAPHHSIFLQVGCSSWCQTNSVKALKAKSNENSYVQMKWLPRSVQLCNVREITKQIVNCKLERDARIWIAFAYHRFKVLDLFDKLILHAVPHDLQK